MTIPNIVRAHGVSEDSLRSHIKNGHISRQMITHYKQLELHHNRNMLAEIDEILDYTKKILKRNYDKKSDYLALKAVSEARNTYQLLAQISWMLHEAQKFEVEQQKETEKAEERSDFENKLDILTFAELEMLEKLHYKIHNQSKEVILPDSRKFGDAIDVEEVDRRPLQRSRNSRGMVRTKQSNRDRTST
jgi:hypothetical protein